MPGLTVPAMNVRPFTSGDEAALVEVWFSSWLSVGLTRPVVTLEDLADRLPHDLAIRWDVTIAEADGRMLGFLAIVLSEQRLDQIFIAPDAQGRGIGQRLFEIAKQKMPRGFGSAPSLGTPGLEHSTNVLACDSTTLNQTNPETG